MPLAIYGNDKPRIALAQCDKVAGRARFCGAFGCLNAREPNCWFCRDCNARIPVETHRQLGLYFRHGAHEPLTRLLDVVRRKLAAAAEATEAGRATVAHYGVTDAGRAALADATGAP